MTLWEWMNASFTNGLIYCIVAILALLVMTGIAIYIGLWVAEPKETWHSTFRVLKCIGCVFLGLVSGGTYVISRCFGFISDATWKLHTNII